MTDATTPSPDGEPLPEDETLGDEVTRVVESAAEFGLGAVIAPFTGGETVSIVGSVASMLEAGVDRLTHLGEHETPPEPDADGEQPDEDDGGGDRESDREDGGGDRESDREDGGASPGAPGPGPDTGGQATDGRG
ncbi:MAG TPA: hypothetical protein VF323_05400 [Candidatus Limnocylindrales bacterium]